MNEKDIKKELHYVYVRLAHWNQRKEELEKQLLQIKYSLHIGQRLEHKITKKIVLFQGFHSILNTKNLIISIADENEDKKKDHTEYKRYGGYLSNYTLLSD